MLRVAGTLEVTEDVEVTGSLKISDVINLHLLSAPLGRPEIGDIYLDDGTNTISLAPSLRLCTNASPTPTRIDL